MDARWSDFYIAIGGSAATLTGLLFVAVSLRPRQIRTSHLMVGRAQSALYAFVTVLFVALLALAGTASKLVGVGQVGVAAAVLGLSTPFTLRARRSGSLNYRRATVYHAGLRSWGLPVRFEPSTAATKTVRSRSRSASCCCSELPSATPGSWCSRTKTMSSTDWTRSAPADLCRAVTRRADQLRTMCDRTSGGYGWNQTRPYRRRESARALRSRQWASPRCGM